MGHLKASQRTGDSVLACLALSLLILASLLALTGFRHGGDDIARRAAAYEPPNEGPGPAADRLFFRAFDVDRAPLDLRAGEMDIYYYGLKIAAARELRQEEGIQLLEVPASTVALLLNPAPAPEGQLNPFSLPEVRQAMQHLVDRDFVAREIYQGQALPMLCHVSPTDFDYLTVYDILHEMDLRYDPEYARARIHEAMTEAGAELTDGIWHYAGQPVRIRLVARVEDERRELGDLVRAELSRAGFQVDMSYQPFAPAVQTVYSSDPRQFSWHVYTEGWGRGAPQRYDFGTINQMSAPWLGNMPGWRELGFWQYEHPRLDELGQRLFRGEFADRAARDQLYREMTRLGLEESVRIWVATVVNVFAARAELEGITEDLAAGPRGIWTLREAYVPGQAEVTVGHLWVWTERTTWNPIGGLGDVYSVDIWNNLHDPPLWNHPFSGIPQPFRAHYSVETEGPQGKMPVPPDAVMWSAERKAWHAVGEGMTATSKVTFDYSRYFQAPWHHGPQVSMADVVYSIYQAFDLAYDPDKARIEVAMAATSRPYLETFRGFRFASPATVEVYVDFWHFDPNYIASYASPTGLSTPWEVLFAMDELVFAQRRAAYSDTAAARFGVPWLSLVMDRDARLVRRVLLDLREGQSIPNAVFDLPTPEGPQALVEPEAALARYDAALKWFDERGHLVISNGPFLLSRYDPPAQFAELTAFRAESYPFRPGDHYKGRPWRIQFVDTEASPIILGEPYQALISLSGPGRLGLGYLLVDPATGEVIAQGDAEAKAVDPGLSQFAVSVDAATTEELYTGLYRLVLVAHSDELAQVQERQVDIDAVLAPPEAEVTGQEPTPTATGTRAAAEPEEDLTPTSAPPEGETPVQAEPTPSPPPERTGVSPGPVVGLVIALAVALAVAWRLLRRRT